MTKNIDECPISSQGLTVICSLLSGSVVLTLMLSMVVYNSYRNKRKRSSIHHQCQFSSGISPPARNDVNTQELQYGVHFPGRPTNSCVNLRHFESSAGYLSTHGIQRNTESFPSRNIETPVNEMSPYGVTSDVPNDATNDFPIDVTVDQSNINLFDLNNSFPVLLKDLYSVSDRSITKNVCGKLLVSIARNVGHGGDMLYLDNMGISLHVPEGAIDVGKSQVIALVLNWDLSDNPSMELKESLVSPVVYVGPHGLQLNKPCTLTFRHCAFDPRQIRIIRSETELNETKAWEAMCDRDDVTGTCYLTPDECRLQIETFTLFTCIQSPLNNVIGKKWLQLAVFASPLRHEANHHQLRVYFLNKTNCALQWAIQNEAKFGGKLVCPEKAFLFDGNELDMQIESKYVSAGWEFVDDPFRETITFVKIWHGQCPHTSICFRRTSNTGQSTSSKKHSLEVNLQLFTFQKSLDEFGENIVAQMFEDKNADKCAIEYQCNHNTNIKVINVYGGSTGRQSDDTGFCGDTHSIYDDHHSFCDVHSPVHARNDVNTSAHARNDKHTSTHARTDAHIPAHAYDAHHSCPVKVELYNSNNVTYNNPKCDKFDTTIVKIIPHELRKQLILLLDPNRSPEGNDWRDLAGKLNMDELIPNLQQRASPTECLLDKIEDRNIGLVELKEMLQDIDRDDCVRVVSAYIKDNDKDDNPSAASKEPTENEHIDSGLQGRRNFNTSESSWNESSGFKSKSEYDSQTVSQTHDSDLTLSKTLYSN